jgi:hypothetical protein
MRTSRVALGGSVAQAWQTDMQTAAAAAAIVRERFIDRLTSKIRARLAGARIAAA